MKEYIAGLCTLKNSALVPVESLAITAKDDDDAVRQAVQWRLKTLTALDQRMWLQVLRDGSAVYSQEIGRI